MRGDGAVFKPPNSRFYWIRYWLSGEQYRETTKTEDLKKAEQFLRNRMKEVGAVQLGLHEFIPPANRKITVSEMLDALRTDYESRGKWNPRVRSHMKALKETKVQADKGKYLFRLGDFGAASLRRKQVDSYIRARQAAKRANATINNELQLLGQAYDVCENVGRGPKIRKLPLQNAREVCFERAEFEALVKQLPEDLQDYARFGYLTGWRHGEIASLSWQDLNMEAQMMRLRHAESKNGEARWIPLERELLGIFQRRWAARTYKVRRGGKVVQIKTERVLVFHRNGKPVKRFDKAWKSACERAGLKAGRFVKDGKVFHDFRRAAATNMRRAGVSEIVAMQITGHRTPSMLRRYNIVNDADLKKAVQMTQDYIATLPTEKKNIVQFPKASGGNGIESA